MSSMATRTVRTLCPVCHEEAIITIRTQFADGIASRDGFCANGCKLSKAQIVALSASTPAA